MKIVVNVYKDGEPQIFDKMVTEADDESFLPQVTDDIEEFLREQMAILEDEL